MDIAEELVKNLDMIQSGIDFFSANYLYRRAELYR